MKFSLKLSCGATNQQGAALRCAYLCVCIALAGLEQFQLGIKFSVPDLLGRVNEMAAQPASYPDC